MNIICFGDSITAYGWPEQLTRLLSQYKPDTFTVFNRGVGGNTSGEGLKRFSSAVAPLLPGLLIVEFGLNDAGMPSPAMQSYVSVEEFSRNLTEFHRIATAAGGTCAFIVNHPVSPPDTTHPQGNGKTYNENAKPYNPATIAAAKTCGAALIDLPMLMAAAGITAADLLGDDGVHLTAQGNILYAQMVLESLQQQDLI